MKHKKKESKSKKKKIKKMSFYGYPMTAFNAMTLPDFVGKSEYGKSTQKI
jgi:hypothetical protein